MKLTERLLPYCLLFKNNRAKPYACAILLSSLIRPCSGRQKHLSDMLYNSLRARIRSSCFCLSLIRRIPDGISST